MSKQSRRYVFTLNNYTAEEIESIGTSTFRYIIYGKEIGESGTPHLQGYMELAKPMTFVAIKKQCPGFQRANFQPAKGTREHNHAYCSKGIQSHAEFDEYKTIGPNWGRLAQVTEIGDWSAGGQGSRTDWHKIYEFIQENPSMPDILREYPEQTIKYTNGIKAALNTIKQEVAKEKLLNELNNFVPNFWQQELLNDLHKAPHNRKVTWIVDEKGGRGKTYLARYLLSNMGACYLTNSKTADGAHAYNGENIVVFDYSRSNEGQINYGIIEQIKNGLIFSPKYDSCTKVNAIPHVVCFSNFQPDQTKLSADRWDIRILDEESTRPSVKIETSTDDITNSYTTMDEMDPLGWDDVYEILNTTEKGVCQTDTPTERPLENISSSFGAPQQHTECVGVGNTGPHPKCTFCDLMAPAIAQNLVTVIDTRCRNENILNDISDDEFEDAKDYWDDNALSI